MEQRRPGKLEAFLALTSTALAVWYMMPAEEQHWLKLRALRAAHQMTTKAALKAGHRGMTDELAGQDFQRYSIAYRLSRLRDRLGRALEDMRP